MRASFGDFVLDIDRRELTRRGKAVRLAPKAFQLLQVLFEARPKAVSQQDLYDQLWPDTFVEKSNLHNLIYQVREALADDDQTIIRTVYGFGFAFAGAGSGVRWQLIVAGHDIDLHEGENIVGRDQDVSVQIEARSISRRHARLVVSSDRVTLEDLGSKNGTTIGDRRIGSVIEVRDGDRIVFGSVPATLRAVRPATSTETVT